MEKVGLNTLQITQKMHFLWDTYSLYYILYLIIFQSFFKHVAAQQVVAAAKPVFQTLAILEKTTTSERLVLNIKLLGMRLTKFLELGGRLGTIHILRTKHLYLIFHKKLGVFFVKTK